MNPSLTYFLETMDDIERQNIDGSNPSSKNVRKEKKKVCKIIIESIKIICSSLLILAVAFLTYFELYDELSKWTMAAQTVTVSSEGPAAEIYPDSMGQYNILKEVYHHGRAVYKHVDREDRFIIFNKRINPGFIPGHPAYSSYGLCINDNNSADDSLEKNLAYLLKYLAKFPPPKKILNSRFDTLTPIVF